MALFDQFQWQSKREMEGIWEAAMAHYTALPNSRKQELRNKFTEIDRDGDGKLSPREYLHYITERWYRSQLFNVADKNRDGMLDLEEFLTWEFIQNLHGWTSCGGCSVILLGMYFVCVKCYDAGETYDLCCKCYGDKSCNHQDDHTYFRVIHSLLQLRKPKPASAADQVTIFSMFGKNLLWVQWKKFTLGAKVMFYQEKFTHKFFLNQKKVIMGTKDLLVLFKL